MFHQTRIALLVLCIPLSVHAQKQISYQAEWSYSKPNNKDITVMIGNVEFQHQGATMYCDSAELHTPKNEFHAFGSVRLIMDTVEIFGDRLYYSGSTKVAVMKGDSVLLQDRDIVLRTQELTYDRKTDIARYPRYGVITDPTGKLESQRGEYATQTNIFLFQRQVVITTPAAHIYSDTLQYNSQTKIATFFGATNLHYHDSTHIFTTEGFYKTDTEEAFGYNGTHIIKQHYYIVADSLYYNGKLDLMRGTQNVYLHDSLHAITVRGDRSEKDGVRQTLWITGHASLQTPHNQDTLFLHADTLFAQQDTLLQNLWQAYHHARFYHSQMQGVCDSFVYQESDSTLRLFQQPILWAGDSQITADTVCMHLAHHQISTILFLGQPLLIQQADSLRRHRYNQMQGKHMTAHFHNGKLAMVDIEGNAESIYYLFDEKSGEPTPQLIGVNVGQSGVLHVFIQEGKPRRITSAGSPRFYTEKEERLGETELRFKRWQWHENRRPLSPEDIFRP